MSEILRDEKELIKVKFFPRHFLRLPEHLINQSEIPSLKFFYQADALS
jgi:hypothetical protein